MPSQVTVLKMYQSNGLWKGTEKKNQRQNPHPWTPKGCGTRFYFCASMCEPRRPSISAPPAPHLITHVVILVQKQRVLRPVQMSCRRRFRCLSDGTGRKLPLSNHPHYSRRLGSHHFYD